MMNVYEKTMESGQWLVVSDWILLNSSIKEKKQ